MAERELLAHRAVPKFLWRPPSAFVSAEVFFPRAEDEGKLSVSVGVSRTVAARRAILPNDQTSESIEALETYRNSIDLGDRYPCVASVSEAEAEAEAVPVVRDPVWGNADHAYLNFTNHLNDEPLQLRIAAALALHAEQRPYLLEPESD